MEHGGMSVITGIKWSVCILYMKVYRGPSISNRTSIEVLFKYNIFQISFQIASKKVLFKVLFEKHGHTTATTRAQISSAVEIQSDLLKSVI